MKPSPKAVPQAAKLIVNGHARKLNEVFRSVLCSRLSVMELLICTCWAVAITRIQQAPSTPSIPGWTANRKKPDKGANTDTSCTRSRTPSPSCAGKKCESVGKVHS